MQSIALQQQPWKYIAAYPSYYAHLLSIGIKKKTNPTSQQAVLLQTQWNNIFWLFKNNELRQEWHHVQDTLSVVPKL